MFHDVHECVLAVTRERPVHDGPYVEALLAQKRITHEADQEIRHLLIIGHAGEEILPEGRAWRVKPLPRCGAGNGQVLILPAGGAIASA